MPKIGDALKRAVETKPVQAPEDSTRAKPTGALMNTNRRNVLQYLCRHPCSRPGSIAKALGISAPSVKWHLGVLVETGYVQSHRSAKPSYCPAGFVTRKNMDVFFALADEKCLSVLRSVMQNPGSDISMLAEGGQTSKNHARSALVQLLELDLVSALKDGRHSRYFPTDKIEAVIKDEAKSRREFVRFLVGRMAAEHLKPELQELKGSDLVISFTTLGKQEKFFIPRHVLPGLDIE